MKIDLEIPLEMIEKIKKWITDISPLKAVLVLSIFLAVVSTIYFLAKDLIVSYGDAESHLNIAKRVVHSITPGFAQLGGIWLPVPHILMIPFVYFDPLWRTGLAGSIVSGAAFIVSSIFLYKLTHLITKSKSVSFIAFLVFAINPNILYLQSTPMTELPLVAFFILSSYFFIKYIINDNDLPALLLSAFFGFCAVLTRYDGWFLVLLEALTILLLNFRKRENFAKIEGRLILFSTLAFFGILIWMTWDLLILGDPFYFTNSQFSARSQQQEWLRRGELPAFRNLPIALAYYLVTSMSNAGVIIFFTAVIGLILFLKEKRELNRYFIAFILLVPVIFNVFTLFVGQSVIFIPHLTPSSFEWRLFNVRYGVLMIPVLSLFFAYIFREVKRSPSSRSGHLPKQGFQARNPVSSRRYVGTDTWVKSLNSKGLLIFLLLVQFALYLISYSKIITLADGTEGLSRAKRPDAEYFMQKNYDNGLVLLDDYARTLSIIRSGIPMQSVIYIGNKPYWEESLVAPERYARWIIMQKEDDVWKAIYDKKNVQGRLFKSFEKVYTSPQILIFRRIN